MAGNIAVELLSMFDFGATSQKSTNGLSPLGSLKAPRLAAYLPDNASRCERPWPTEEADTAKATICSGCYCLRRSVGRQDRPGYKPERHA